MRSRSTTIKDIARHLGISHSTVSRALTGAGNLSAETRQAVLEAAEKLHYVPNSSARLMRAEHGSLVGLVVPDIQNDFYSAVAKRLAEKCRVAQFQMMLCITEDDPDIEEENVRSLIEARAVGIVITPTVGCRESTIALLKMISTVQMVRQTKDIAGDVVRFNDEKAMASATRHLLDLGHRRIGYVGVRRDVSAGQARLAGFLSAYRDMGLEPVEEAILLGPPRQAFGQEAVSRLLDMKERPTAILAGSTVLALGGLSTLRDARISIPTDMSVVVFGDPAWFQLFDPPLTALRLPIDELAQVTADHLFRQIRPQGEEKTQVREVLDFELVVRASSAPPTK